MLSNERRCSQHIVFVLLSMLFISLPLSVPAADIPTSLRADKAIAKVTPRLKKFLADKGLTLGSPVFIRIFKQTRELELWVQSGHQGFVLFKRYNICYFSGKLGPKLREGDRQSPEGFYFVSARRLNPWSRFHLSFNLGYPNAYDRAHGRTGSALMVHGSCVSIGCYAMTDDGIDEIYAMAYAALKGGQPFFRVHIFPFKLDDNVLKKYQHNRWYDFWLNMKQGYDYFNTHKKPPNVTVANGRYVFGE